MPAIYVCPKSQVPEAARRLRPSHLITLLDPADDMPTPEEISGHRHLRLGCHDIAVAQPDFTAPDQNHVRELIAFAQGWDRTQPILIHCWAGISRSTASAFTIACMLNPRGRERDIAMLLRERAAHAHPNPRIVAIADALLERDGAMVDAYFVAFAGEVMDGYGRLLGWINREQRDTPRPLDYNSRLLAAGYALPYFIWPNINPFRKQASAVEAVPVPGTAALVASREGSLRESRRAVRAARDAGKGVFAAADPLKLEPFELRFLAGRRAPTRWVIDLSSDSDALLPPQRYYEIARPEDRLYVPPEFVPLFVERGWRRG